MPDFSTRGGERYVKTLLLKQSSSNIRLLKKLPIPDKSQSPHADLPLPQVGFEQLVGIQVELDPAGVFK